MSRNTETVYAPNGQIPYTIVGLLVWGREPYTSNFCGDVQAFHCPLCYSLVIDLIAHEGVHVARGDLQRITTEGLPCTCDGTCHRTIHPKTQPRRVCQQAANT